MDFAGVLAEGFGDVRHAEATEQANAGIAKGCQELRSAPRADAAGVLAEGIVPHPMQTVFDAPMPTPPGEQSGGIGQVTRDARDGVVDLDRLLAVAVRGPLDAADLLGGRPIEMAGQTSRRLEMAVFPATVLLVARASFIQRFATLLFGVGGKRPAEIQRRCRLAGWAGCL